MNADGDLLLAIDTSGIGAGLALAGAGSVDTAALGAGPAGSARTEDLAAGAARLLAARGASVRDLRLLAAVVGPGSYTGLRSGLAFLRGIAFAGTLPAVGVGALELLAWCGGRPGEIVVAACGAGRGRVLAAGFRREDHNVVEIAAPTLLDEAGAAEARFGRRWKATALVVAAHASPADPVLEALAAVARDSAIEIRAAGSGSLVALVELARERARRGAVVAIDALLPTYVGEAAARPNTNRVAVVEASE